MVLTSSQQLMVAFTAVLFAFVVFPRMFNGGAGTKEARGFDQRYSRKGAAGPATAKPHQFNTKAGEAQSFESMQKMSKMMEQELKSDKYKSNGRGYVFTLMPLYAIGVGVFAAYKFLKIKSKDDSDTDKTKTAKGSKKSEETENQLNELEQRLAQTEKMLNSILTQLDPLTNCVKSVASEQKDEIMSQLQSIRHLMKKRGMDCAAVIPEESSCEKKLEDVIDTLTMPESQSDAAGKEEQEQGNPGEEEVASQWVETGSPSKAQAEGGEFQGDAADLCTLDGPSETGDGKAGIAERPPETTSGSGLRRRIRPE